MCQLSVNLDWTPNRAVILAVHRYWVGKLYRHRRWAEFSKATGGGHHHPAAIPRSFSASPPVVSGRSDMSAMTLEDFALSQVHIICHFDLLILVVSKLPGIPKYYRSLHSCAAGQKNTNTKF